MHLAATVGTGQQVHCLFHSDHPLVHTTLLAAYTLFGSSSSLQSNSVFLSCRSSTSFQPPASQQYFSLTPLQPSAPTPAQRTELLQQCNACTVVLVPRRAFCLVVARWCVAVPTTPSRKAADRTRTSTRAPCSGAGLWCFLSNTQESCVSLY